MYCRKVTSEACVEPSGVQNLSAEIGGRSPSPHLPVYGSPHLPIYLPTYLSIYLSIYMCIYIYSIRQPRKTTYHVDIEHRARAADAWQVPVEKVSWRQGEPYVLDTKTMLVRFCIIRT